MRNKILASAAITFAILIPGTAYGWAQASQASQAQVMPPGFHWRQVRSQIGDCGPRNQGQVKVIMWKGTGGRQSVLFCPDGTIWPS